MTRDFSLTVNNTSSFLNLWDGFIAPTITDKTFSNSPYVSSMVSDLIIQVATAGQTITKTDKSQTGGIALTSLINPPYSIHSLVNSIDLKGQYIKTSAAGVVINVSINWI